MASSKNRVTELEGDLKKAIDRVDAAEVESGLLKERVRELELKLESRKPEEEVIAAFKNSEEYIIALAGAAVVKLQRCWLVAERHIKTDVDSSWVAAEEAFDADGTEPERYDGPNPVIPSVSTTEEARTSNLEDTRIGDDANQT